MGLLQIQGARGLQALRMVRLLRLLTLFRVDRSTNSFTIIFDVFQKKRSELTASLASAFVIMVMSGTLMYYAENAAQPDKFSSIPASMWWSVAALTTVGYGEVARRGGGHFRHRAVRASCWAPRVRLHGTAGGAEAPRATGRRLRPRRRRDRGAGGAAGPHRPAGRAAGGDAADPGGVARGAAR